jgi:hypothetical protein
MKMPTPEQMKKRFWTLKEKRDAIWAKRDPIRETRDRLSIKHAKEMEAANKKVRAAEEGLFDIEQEMASLARACGGRMGEPE